MSFVKEFIMRHPIISCCIGIFLVNKVEDNVNMRYARAHGTTYKGHYISHLPNGEEEEEKKNEPESECHPEQC